MHDRHPTRPQTPTPRAITQQAITLTIQGNTVEIDCDNHEDASQIFEWLESLASEQ